MSARTAALSGLCRRTLIGRVADWPQRPQCQGYKSRAPTLSGRIVALLSPTILLPMFPPIADIYSAPRLAAELGDAIIDYLRDDKKALFPSSLVCTGWLPRARCNTFQTNTLQVKNCANLLDLMDRTPEIVACVILVALQPAPPGRRPVLAIKNGLNRPWPPPSPRPRRWRCSIFRH